MSVHGVDEAVRFTLEQKHIVYRVLLSQRLCGIIQ